MSDSAQKLTSREWPLVAQSGRSCSLNPSQAHGIFVNYQINTQGWVMNCLSWCGGRVGAYRANCGKRNLTRWSLRERASFSSLSCDSGVGVEAGDNRGYSACDKTPAAPDMS
jgi:hypothetical protein